MREIIQQKLADAVTFEIPRLTRRDIRLPAIPRRAHAVIGMRRSGKTCFLHQCMADRLASGVPRDALVYFSFEDERLAGMKPAQLSWILEEYFLRFPQHRDARVVAFCFDEIQVVPGWEQFIRRVLDTEKVDVFVSGSSAKLLSREVATALRGRATETVVYPFSFAEFLRHGGNEVPTDPAFLAKARRSKIERLFELYLARGGFPETQGLEARDSIGVLQAYVDSVIFRDVVERHHVTNVLALRQLTRQLLGNAAGLFSVHRFLNDLRSQGVMAAKDALHEMLGHLEDAFLVQLVPLATSSERQRQSNPRKAYPIDPGLVGAFDRSGKPNMGHTLETAVMVELKRRVYELGYVRTPDGFEVDFLATPRVGRPRLIQVCADLSDPATRHREFRAMESARAMHRSKLPGLVLVLKTQDAIVGQADAPKGVEVRAAWEWLLQSET